MVLACHTSDRCSTVCDAESAASFQPSKAAMTTGERRTGRPSNSVTGPAYVPLRRLLPGTPGVAVSRPSATLWSRAVVGVTCVARPAVGSLA